MIQDMNGEDVIRMCKKCKYRMCALWNLDGSLIEAWFCNMCYRRDLKNYINDAITGLEELKYKFQSSNTYFIKYKKKDEINE